MLIQHIESHFSFLDALPEGLYNRVVALRHGRLKQRVEGILQWRAALLRGELPEIEKLDWPERSVSEIILKRMDALELAPYCQNEESLVDHVLKDICTAVEGIEQRRQQGTQGLFDDVLPSQKPRCRENPCSFSSDNNSPEIYSESNERPQQVTPENHNTMLESSPQDISGQSGPGEFKRNHQSQIVQSLVDAPHTIDIVDKADQDELTRNDGIVTLSELDTDLQRRWDSLLNRWKETDAVFRGMGARLGRGWDLSKGILVSEGWREFVAYRKKFKDSAQLKTLVNNLGRSFKETEKQHNQEIPKGLNGEETPNQQRTHMKKIRSEDPMSTRGVTRSDDIARMLPQEAAFLGHAQLHMLWHAKRAEQALLSYHVEGVMSQHRFEPSDNKESKHSKKKTVMQSRGPFILCVDTSASMRGEPERIAKALCLEVIRLANQQDRRCMLYAFSGPGQLLQTSVSLNPSGLKSIIRFLQQTFHGGTDISEPITQAINKVREKAWQKADMLLISDGRFPVSDSLVKLVHHRHNNGLRLQGIAIGRWKTTSMNKICETVARIEEL